MAGGFTNRQESMTGAAVLWTLAAAVVLRFPVVVFSQPVETVELTPQLSVFVHAPCLNTQCPPTTYGYLPVVCVIENRDTKRHIVDAQCWSDYRRSAFQRNAWSAVRRVTVEPKSTARMTIWLPPPITYDSELQFSVDDRRTEWTRRLYSSMNQSQGFPPVLASGEAARQARSLALPAAPLGIHLAELAVNGFDSPWYDASHGVSMPTAVGHAVGLRVTAVPPSGVPVPIVGGSGSSSTAAGGAQDVWRIFHLIPWQVSLNVWDDRWISYSAFPGMILTPRDWEEAPAGVKDAIVRWVECGGVLAFLDLRAGEKIASNDSLHTVPPSELPSLPDAPVDADARERRRRILASFPTSDAAVALLGRELEEEGPFGQRPHPCGFGEVYYVIGQSAEVSDSTRTIRIVNPSAAKLLVSWAQSVRNRFADPSQSLGNEGTLTDNLSVVRGAGLPVVGFFILLVGFSVLIGPVAISVLTRYRRRVWLMWLVPAVAAVTCLVVFAYGFLSEGVWARVAIRALTVLDERHHRATTLGVVGLYSPITPLGGLQFDYDSEVGFDSRFDIVASIYARSTYGYYGSARRLRRNWQVIVDWSTKQHLVSGWVLPRVPEFVTVRRSEVRRERLTLRRDGKRLYAGNGLGVGLRNLLLCDHDGKWWRADYVAAGDEVELQACQPPQQYESLVKSVGLHSASVFDQRARSAFQDSAVPSSEEGNVPSKPQGANAGSPQVNQVESLNVPPGQHFPGMLSEWFVAGGGRLRGRPWGQSLLASNGPRPETLLCPGRYFAEMEWSRFLDPGLRWIGVRQDRCWVLGMMESPRED